ncbi:hypothetical protein BVRB_022720 [Beta vulgaris subsp. vulgaris]|uniref:Uncharacterized protein n=1 Tax=Beta vulgaris subsp. vulgaris TaxID=3555 RepID=A0A0J8B385_BETVV|nr:hypothetical protein BVRB_022720 [Beta vulgaris subsp. vulgaris]
MAKIASFRGSDSDENFRLHRSELMRQIDQFANAKRLREGLPPLPAELLVDFSSMPHISFS